MKHSAVKVAFVVCGVLLVIAPENVDGVCCYARGISLFCADCKVKTPYCGVGRCNIFGCNCDGGCRTGTCKPSWGKRDGNDVDTAGDVIRLADVDGDGVLSVREGDEFVWRQHGERLSSKSRRYRLAQMDVDKDGVLNADEIDS